MQYSDITILLRQKLHGLYPVREIESIAFLLAGCVTGLSRVQLMLNGDRKLTTVQISQIEEMTRRLQHLEPIQYVLGETEFCGLRLRTRPGVLIPRGETEELVGWLLRTLENHADPKHAVNQQSEKAGKVPLKILDIGCGSGAIAIALAKALPEAEVVAADLSAHALNLTRENASLNRINLRILPLDILSWPHVPRPGDDQAPLQNNPVLEDFAPFDIIVSNPPYIPMGEKSIMDVHVVDYEPEIALFVPDSDPMIFYRAIAEFSHANLTIDGQVFVEIHDRFGQETLAIFKNWFPFTEIKKDIHGKDRMIRAYHG